MMFFLRNVLFNCARNDDECYENDVTENIRDKMEILKNLSRVSFRCGCWEERVRERAFILISNIFVLANFPVILSSLIFFLQVSTNVWFQVGSSFSAPEILKCQPYGHAVDWYALGVVACLMLTDEVNDLIFDFPWDSVHRHYTRTDGGVPFPHRNRG